MNWREKEVTEKQKCLLRSFGFEKPESLPKTRGEACDMISNLFRFMKDQEAQRIWGDLDRHWDLEED